MSEVEKIICDFCKTSIIDELNLGKIYEHKNIKAHYHCLLLSSNSIVTGNDEDGIMGFMPKIIKGELKRGIRLKCCYCKKNTATIGCAIEKCQKVFHLPCGIEAGIISQFYDEFPSFCPNHAPNQDNILDKLSEEQIKKHKKCDICLDPIKMSTINTPLWATCCQNGWFHRACMQKFAKSAGEFFFKCPLCNNTKEFTNEMKRMGIYIPEQDASWEQEPYAFEDLLFRYDKCDAEKCLCTNGRKYNKPETIWKILLCKLCGSSGMHIGCKRLPRHAVSVQCPTCTSGIKNRTRLSKGKRKQILPETELPEQFKKARRGENSPPKNQGRRTVMLKKEHLTTNKAGAKYSGYKLKKYLLRSRN